MKRPQSAVARTCLREAKRRALKRQRAAIKRRDIAEGVLLRALRSLVRAENECMLSWMQLERARSAQG